MVLVDGGKQTDLGRVYWIHEISVLLARRWVSKEIYDAFVTGQEETSLNASTVILDETGSWLGNYDGLPIEVNGERVPAPAGWDRFIGVRKDDCDVCNS